ncbi:MAG: hypothetical protein AVDCRST_MAG54-4194 [uncultured Actinomycetospora sp.]|uniref:AB hydrolase-1 domain-containing protein n=1 Tax=uncultured Actinomycetospora sp. TaxID=1135996 RepID=A0A6J4JUY5_9PSEU|nr:MAG: hypothetical protein AVDCRST_MAG54-4194 [uncultured Actinomycetospora sp.]
MHTRFSTRGHQRVAYDVVGPATAPAVVLLHDLLGQRSSLSAVRDRLGDFIRCVSIDLRGHGASATISGASIDLGELALDVAAVLAQEELASAIFIGHGLGGAVARRLASELPSFVTAIVAIQSPEVGLAGEPLVESDRRAADLAYKGLADAALVAYLTPRLGSTWRDDLPRPTVAAHRRHAPALATLLPALAQADPAHTDAETGVTVVEIDSALGRLDLPPESADAITEAVERFLPSTER